MTYRKFILNAILSFVALCFLFFLLFVVYSIIIVS